GSAKEDCPASAAARQAPQGRNHAETLRLLYVALTRARDRLILFGRACGNSKQGYDDGSWWDVLTETFGRLGEAVRKRGEIRRFGPDPVRLTPAPRGAAVAAGLPP